MDKSGAIDYEEFIQALGGLEHLGMDEIDGRYWAMMAGRYGYFLGGWLNYLKTWTSFNPFDEVFPAF